MQIDEGVGSAARGDAGSANDIGHPPTVVVEVLFPLQAVAADGDAVVGGEHDVGVGEHAVGLVAVAVRVLELCEHAADLAVDPVVTGKLASDFVADDRLGAVLADALDRGFVAHLEVAMVERMGRIGGRGTG